MKVRRIVGAVLIGCALPGVALAGADPAAAAAPAPPQPAPPQPAPPQPYAQPPAYPVPYGYPPAPGYSPAPGYPPSAYFTAPRLAVLDAQIGELQMRRDEITLGLPLTLLIGGGVLGVVGLVMVGAALCSTDENGNQIDPGCVQNQSAVNRGVGFFVLGMAGVGIGTVSLIIRGAKRRHLSRQIAARQLEANALRGMQPRWGIAPTPNGGGTFSLAFDF